MSDKKKTAPEQEAPETEVNSEVTAEEVVTETAPEETPETPEAPAPDAPDAAAELRAAEDKYLRLAAEYDNYRKRTTREKESAWSDSKAETAAAFLPVYDNLERALKTPCTDEAYAKGVELIMQQFKTVLKKLGIEEIPALGETFDPNLHNAVMHVEDESVGENTIVEVFQAGFKLGEKVIRFAMVKVAN